MLAVVKYIQFFSLTLMFLFVACSDDAMVEDPCTTLDSPEVMLGSGVGGQFSAFIDNEEVGLVVAPQGGFGVQTVIRTHGLAAGNGTLATATLDVTVDDQQAGTFTVDAPLQCSDGIGGQIFGQVVGFDPAVYQTNDDLLNLDGSIVILEVSVTDENGNTAEAVQPVTVRVGG